MVINREAAVCRLLTVTERVKPADFRYDLFTPEQPVTNYQHRQGVSGSGCQFFFQFSKLDIVFRVTDGHEYYKVS